MKQILVAFTALFLFAACTSKPVQNLDSRAIPAGLSDVQIEKAITDGLIAKGWSVKSKKPGYIQGEIYVRSHRAEIQINYTQSNYSIRYLSSDNLKYKESKGTIHKNYNKWITLLDSQIQSRLTQQATANS